MYLQTLCWLPGERSLPIWLLVFLNSREILLEICFVNCVHYLSCMEHYTLCQVSKKRHFWLLIESEGQTISGYSHILPEFISGIIVSAFL